MTDPASKLSPEARRLLSAQRTPSEAGERVDLLIRVQGDPDTARPRLAAAGASVRTAAGDVLTASAPVSALQPLAALGDVMAIEVSTPLFGESPPTG